MANYYEDYKPILINRGMRKVLLDDWYDSMENALDMFEERLSESKSSFKTGKYWLSSYLKETKQKLEFYNTIWDIVSEDTEHTEYYVYDGEYSQPYICEIHTIQKACIEYNREQKKWVVIHKTESLPVYVNLYALKKDKDISEKIADVVSMYSERLEELAFAHAEDCNSEGNETIICKQCGKPFILTDRNRFWFTSRGLSLPKRCDDCRKQKAVQSE